MNEQKLLSCHNLVLAGRKPGCDGTHTRHRKALRAHDWERELQLTYERLRTMRRSTVRGAVVFTSLLESRALHVCLEAQHLLDNVRAAAPRARRTADA